MHHRIVTGVALSLCAMLAMSAIVIVGINDYSTPRALNATAGLTVDAAGSGLDDDQVYDALRRLDVAHDLRLLKRAPDLEAGGSAQIFVKLRPGISVPRAITRFDGGSASVREPSTLSTSAASGQYLVTGASGGVKAVRSWGRSHDVRVTSFSTNLRSTAGFVLKQPSFAASLFAVVALLVSLVLYWLTVKARGRALRVLAGVPSSRIQYEDLTAFALPVTAAAVVAGTGFGSWVGLSHGAAYVPIFLQVYGSMVLGVVVLTVIVAILMSIISRPRPTMLARREPAVGPLRGVTSLVKMAVLAAVLLAVVPALGTWRSSHQLASQLAQWRSLSDQVTLWFPAASGEDGFQRTKHQVASVVADAERRGSAALSYGWDADLARSIDVDLPEGEAFGLVSPTWVRLMSRDVTDRPALKRVNASAVPRSMRGYVDASWSLWTRDGERTPHVEYYRQTGDDALPIAAAGSGALIFPRTSVVAVVPEPSRTFDDDFLASVSTSGNIVLTGLGPTTRLIDAAGIGGQVRVRYAAEQGVLEAQYTSYLAWLQGVALVALVVSLAVAAAVGAFISAVLNARRDFAMRVTGARWRQVVGRRVVSEWSVGLGLVAAVVAVRGGTGIGVVLPLGLVLLALLPLLHVAAGVWVFTRSVQRTI